MSGDVQPRKRKDKKRKKDDSAEQTIHPPSYIPPTVSPSDDVNIHVHKEGGTGGGICAKIIFFILFSTLLVLIGLIITEHRGLTDLDIIESESRYSQIFQGFVDNSHDDHVQEAPAVHEDGLEKHDHSDEDDDHVDEEDEDHGSEQEEIDITEEDQEDDEQKSEEEDEALDESDEERPAQQSEEEIDDEIKYSDENQEDSEEREDEEDEVEEQDQEEDDNVSDVNSDEADDDVPENDEDDVTGDDDDDDDIAKASEEEEAISDENEDETKEGSEEIAEEDGDGDDDASKVERNIRDVSKEDAETEAVPEEDKEQKSGSMVAKIGVGVALLVVAHVVLVRKWRTGSGERTSSSNTNTNEAPPDLSRRNTIVPPPPLREIEQDIENDEEGVNVSHDNEPEESDSDKQSESDNAEYEYTNLTNKEDWKIKDQIDKGQKAVQNNAAYAIKIFDAILEKYPSSPRSLYGKALALDYLAHEKKSNDVLERAIAFYLQLFQLKNVPDALFQIAAERCIERLRFIGQYRKATFVNQALTERFPSIPKYKNDLAVTYLIMNRVTEARVLFKETLTKWPENGVALVHYGFILKTVDNKLNESVYYMKKGIQTQEPGVIDGRFYFHLGDALARLGRTEESTKIYEEGVAHKLFLSKFQRSLYNVNRLTGKPWWSKEELPYKSLLIALERNWKVIRDEGLSVLNELGYFTDESENLKHKGDWKQFELFARGTKNGVNCKKCPITCQIIQNNSDAKTCKRGQTKFSIMHPGTHVWPHCGPTNCRLRIHLGLKVPPKTYIRVANEIRSWKNGELLIFDDSFEHEVWHNGSDFRLVLIVDVWHPELTPMEKRSLSPI